MPRRIYGTAAQAKQAARFFRKLNRAIRRTEEKLAENPNSHRLQHKLEDMDSKSGICRRRVLATH